MTGYVDDLGDTADGIFQYVVGVRKGLVLRHIITQHIQQFFVQDNDQRVHIGFELGQTVVGVGHAASALPVKGLGHHADCQDAHLLGHTRDDRRCASAGAAAHTRGDEQHVRAGNRFTDVFDRQFGGFTTAFRLAARTQAATAQLNSFVRCATAQCLGIGVGANELDALHAGLDHVLNSVAAAAAYADHLDLGALVELFGFNHFNAHRASCVRCSCLIFRNLFFLLLS